MDHLIAAARCLKDRGAYKVYVVATHAIFTKSAAEQLEESVIDEVGHLTILKQGGQTTFAY